MTLTFDQARAAFQNAIPNRREDFDKRVNDRRKSIASESNYPGLFPVDVLKMAEDELRVRHELAAQRVRQLLESGWKPEYPTGIKSAFVNMFSGFDDWRKDPSSDLYAHVETAFEKVGLHAPAETTKNARRLGEVQVQTSNEFIADLECYAAKYLDDPTLTGLVNAGGGVVAAVPALPWKYDVFISHASEDKIPFVNELADALRVAGLEVWFDRFSLTVGDNLRERIDDGLRSARYGVVVLSPAFFAKQWPKLELEGLFVRQTRNGTNVILPVWHEMSIDEVASHSPMLAGRLAAKSSEGIAKVVGDLLEAMRTEQP